MVKYPKTKICKFCGGDAHLMELPKSYGLKGKGRYYYYHYSEDYDLGCRQRLNVDSDLLEDKKEE